ncbi:MAG: hypothetical protein ACE5DO_12305, partial [Desulfobacterales bacterium]
MAELVKVYENDDIANDDLGCYVAKNQEIVERVIPRKNNLWGSKIELSHLIELTALEQDGSLGYFLNDGV